MYICGGYTWFRDEVAQVVAVMWWLNMVMDVMAECGEYVMIVCGGCTVCAICMCCLGAVAGYGDCAACGDCTWWLHVKPGCGGWMWWPDVVAGFGCWMR